MSRKLSTEKVVLSKLDPDQLLKLTEVAGKILPMSERCLWTKVKEGAIPSARIGRFTYLRVRDVQAYLDGLFAQSRKIIPLSPKSKEGASA